jgi:hypothetical protein
VADEIAPGRNIPNQYYQLSAKMTARSTQETRSSSAYDGGDDKDDRGNSLFEIGNAVASIVVTQDDWSAMYAEGDVNLNTARRIHVPRALGSVLKGKKIAPESISGIYW